MGFFKGVKAMVLTILNIVCTMATPNSEIGAEKTLGDIAIAMYIKTTHTNPPMALV